MLLRQLLHPGIDRAHHHVVPPGLLLGEVEAEAGALQLAAHVVAEERIAGETGVPASRGIDVERPAPGIDQGLITQIALLMHQLEHQIATVTASLGILPVAGAVAIGTGQQTHQESRLGHIQISGRLAEIEA